MKRAPVLAVVAVVAALAGACSNHYVSPYPPVDPSDLLVPANDLDGNLARADHEASSLGMREVDRVEGKLEGGHPFVIVAYRGKDALGRDLDAVRVVTPSGIVLALGPPDVKRDPTEPTRFVRALLPEGGFPSGVDLTGDGAPDVLAKADDGTIAVYRIDLAGGTRYPVKLLFPPTRVLDANGDGRFDLGGVADVPAGDAIAPELLDVAVCEGVTYRNDGDDARAFHARRRDAPEPEKTATKAVKLRDAVERAFHAIRAGDDVDEAIQAASDRVAKLAPLDEALATSWVRWRGWLVDHARGENER